MAEIQASMKSLVEFIRRQPRDRPTTIPDWGSSVLSEYIREELGVTVPLMAYPQDLHPFLTQLILETKSSGVITALMKPSIPNRYGDLIIYMTLLWPRTATYL